MVLACAFAASVYVAFADSDRQRYDVVFTATSRFYGGFVSYDYLLVRPYMSGVAYVPDTQR